MPLPLLYPSFLRSSFNKSDMLVNLLFPFFNCPCHVLLLNKLFIRIQEALCLPDIHCQFQENQKPQGMSHLAIPIDNTWNDVIRLQLIRMYHNPSYGVDHPLVLVICIRICEANPGIWPPFGCMRQWTRWSCVIMSFWHLELSQKTSFLLIPKEIPWDHSI